MICCDFCEEWFHGDWWAIQELLNQICFINCNNFYLSVNITEKESKAIKKYYCDRCREADPTLRTVIKGAPIPQLHQQPSSTSNGKDKELLKKKKDKSESRCGNCDGCRSRAMGKKGKCEKRLSLYQQKKKEKKLKEGRLKWDHLLSIEHFDFIEQFQQA